MKKFLIYSFSALVLISFNQCATNPVTGKKQVVLMSEEQEIAMGREADPQIIAQFGLYEDQSMQNYINAMGQQMVKISHRPGIKYEFKILDSEVINAFAVPGGYVYFTRGIMSHFNNEAQMAGVLGHELGHIAARHSVEQQRNQILGQLGLIAGIIIAPELVQFADAASTGLSLLFLKFSRDAERESDELGVEYSSKIGYDAKEMADFFNTLERQGQSSGSSELPEFLSTHPNPGDRNTKVKQLAKDWQRKLNLTNPQVNRNEYLRKIEGMIYGEDPKGGYKEGNMFYHPVLRFQFPIPANWNYQNTPQSVQMASKDGKALMMLMLGRGNSLQEAANSMIQQFSLQVVESGNTTVNGLPALVVVADQRSQQSQAVLRTISYLIQYNNTIYHMIGVSSLNDFNAYNAYFSNSMQNFRQLTDPAKLNKKPDRVRLKTARANQTLASLFRENNIPESRHNEMAILNGMQLNQTLSSGTLVKVIAQ